jgi:hypothetical protein
MGDAKLGDTPHHPELEMTQGSGGIDVDDKPFMPTVTCSDCHGYEKFSVRHSFAINYDACSDCHDFYTTKTAREQVKKWQANFDTLITNVEKNISAAESLKEDYQDSGKWTSELDRTFDRAWFNYALAKSDGSNGAHNPYYAEELLNKANEDANKIINPISSAPIFVSPANGEIDVPVTANITIRFTQMINFTNLVGNDYLKISGGINGNLRYDPVNFTVIFEPDTNFRYNTKYIVTIDRNITFLDGKSVILDDFRWSFTTEILDSIKFSVGPIIDNKELPMEGVVVETTIGGVLYSKSTNETGFVTFEIPGDVYIPPTMTFMLNKTGYELLEFEGFLNEDNEFVPEGGSIPILRTERHDEEEDDNILLIQLILVVMLIIVLIIIIAYARRSPEEEETFEDDYDLDDDEDDEYWEEKTEDLEDDIDEDMESDLDMVESEPESEHTEAPSELPEESTITEEPLAEEPVVEEEPVAEEEPVIDEEPIPEEEPTSEEPIPEEPEVEEPPVEEEPITEEEPLVDEEPIEDEPGIEEESLVEEELVEEEPIPEEEPIEEEPALEDSTIEEEIETEPVPEPTPEESDLGESFDEKENADVAVENNEDIDDQTISEDSNQRKNIDDFIKSNGNGTVNYEKVLNSLEEKLAEGKISMITYLMLRNKYEKERKQNES